LHSAGIGFTSIPGACHQLDSPRDDARQDISVVFVIAAIPNWLLAALVAAMRQGKLFSVYAGRDGILTGRPGRHCSDGMAALLSAKYCLQ